MSASFNGFIGQAQLYMDPTANAVTLTSGIEGYPATVLSGADIRINTTFRNQAPWELEQFQRLLSHEIGHTLGLNDVDPWDGDPVFTPYYDDNYDATSDATALATLTNSFANSIDQLDPDNSPGLSPFEPCSSTRCNNTPGFDSPGVHILMETDDIESFVLQNDDFAGRQFLYPFVRVPGDFNADKILTVEDVDLLLEEMGKSTPRTWFDLTGNELVNLDDRSAWVELRGTFVGDANLDGQVNAVDLNVLALSWGADNATSWSQGDFNGDDIVNAIDLNDLALNWRNGATQASPVPERSSIGLVAMAGLVMFVRCRH
jgi:hypothetical protein